MRIMYEMDCYNTEEPVCPFCKEKIVIHEHECFELYEEDTHEFKCPFCKKVMQVEATATYSFTTQEPD